MNIFPAGLFRSFSRSAVSVIRNGILFCRGNLEKKIAAVAIVTLRGFANCYIAVRHCLSFIGTKITSRETVFEDEMEKTITQGNLILSPERVNNRKAQVVKLQGEGRVALSDGTIYEGPMAIMVNDSGQFFYPDGGSYTGEIRNNQPNGKGKRTYSDEAYYDGYFKDGIPHGLGEMHKSDGTKERGIFREGLLNDEKGEIIYSDGSFYKGRVERGKPHDFGVLRFGHGDVYIGNFKNGMLEGQGEMKYGNGCVYNGAFARGKRHGRGILKDPQNGTTYEGSFIGGLANGNGKISYSSDESVYIGDVKEGRPEGWGKLTLADGKTVEGDFTKGTLHGPGTIIFRNLIYRGIIKDLKANGLGTMSFVDKKIKGTFAADQPVGVVEVTYLDDGRVYQGQTQDGEPNGQGSMTYVDGIKHEGIFRNGKLNDPNGKITYPNKSVYEGPVRDGVPDGRGTLETMEKTYQGAFEQGKIQGQGVLIFKDNGTRHAGTFIDGKLHGPGIIVLHNTTGIQDTTRIQVEFEHGRLKKDSFRNMSSNQQDTEIEFQEDEQSFSMMEF